MTSILTENQRKVLDLFSRESSITNAFYLSGGTALSEFHLHHRLSEDLDFFSEEEVDPQSVSIIVKKIQLDAGITNVTYEQSFNRNLFFLHLSSDVIKTEFTYYPFPRIEEGMRVGDLAVDSLIDIAVNKLFTISQKPRSRDFIDLFCILREKKEWDIDDLIAKAKIKFDHHIDLLQLSAQFVKATELKDYPRMLIDLKEEEWQGFFMDETKRLAQSQIE